MKVDKSVAIADIERWLDYKRISDKKRESNKEYIDSLVSEIEEGNLTVNDDCILVYSLKFAIEDEGGNPTLEQLTFKPRMRTADLDPYLKGVKATDADGRVRAHICALTGKGMAMIGKLDTEDISVCSTIAVFFL